VTADLGPPLDAPAPGLALVRSDGPARDRLAAELRAALADVHLTALPDGSGAIHDAVAALRPDCVVVDTDLLEENPFELCARLRTAPATRDLKLVVIGDHLGPDQQALLRRMGVDQVVLPPVDAGRLARAIEQALGR
jgi:PleD family two-component response regulator